MLLKLTVIGWCVIAVHAVFNANEVEIILSSLRFFKIGKCILTCETTENTVKDAVKKLNKNFISTAFMRVESLEKYVHESKFADGLTGIVIKVKKSSALKRLFVENANTLSWFVWFLIAEDELDPEIRIPFDTQFFQIKTDSSETRRLIENFHVKNSTTFEKEFGVWTPNKGLTASSVNIYKRRTDLGGIELEITVCNTYDVEEALKTFWKDTARILNFTLKMELQKLSKTPTGYVVLQNPDGTTCIWGITGLDSESDWIFSSFGNKVKLAIKFRSANEIGWKAYVRPFRREMWMAVGLWLLLSTTTTVIVNGFTKKTLYLNIFTGFFYLCNTDPMAAPPPDGPVPFPVKLVNLMSAIVPAVLIPAYSAYILSTLSIVRPLKPFNDLKGFIADGSYKLTAVDNTFAIRYLRGSNDPHVKYIYENIFVGADNVPLNFAELFEQLCKDNQLAGLFVDVKAFRQLFQCKMFVMPEEVTTISTGVLLPKGSPLQKVLNERLAQYLEKGIKGRTTGSQPVFRKKFNDETEGINSLNLSQIGPIFLLLPLGVVSSLMVLAAELTVKIIHPTEDSSKLRRNSETVFYGL